MRGLGTYISKDTVGGEPQLVAAAAGHVERINKLITVNPINSKYTGEVGDLVIGRITAVENKRWKADVLAHRDAVLQLSSVHLPGGEQRMRNAEDQLQMRSLFEEGDCVSGEIQNISNNNTGDSGGVISLHTRSLKYGKLENGLLVQVPAHCVKRLPQHYVSLPVTSLTENNATITNHMDVVLGKNGYIWITRSIPEEWKTQLSVNSSSEGVDVSIVLYCIVQSVQQQILWIAVVCCSLVVCSCGSSFAALCVCYRRMTLPHRRTSRSRLSSCGVATVRLRSHAASVRTVHGFATLLSC